MKTGEEKKERQEFLEVVTTLITAVMVVYNHGHGRDGHGTNFPPLFLLVTGVMVVHVVVTGVMDGRDHH